MNASQIINKYQRFIDQADRAIESADRRIERERQRPAAKRRFDVIDNARACKANAKQLRLDGVRGVKAAERAWDAGNWTALCDLETRVVDVIDWLQESPIR